VSPEQPEERIRTLVCVQDPVVLDALRQMLDVLGHFVPDPIVSDSDDLIAQCHESFPDVVMIDEELASGSVEALLAEARAGRPLPCVVFGAPERPTRKKRRANVPATATTLLRLDREALCGPDEGARAQLQTRLLLLAAEIGTARRTQTDRTLQEAIRMVRARARHTDVRPEVLQLGTNPLDLLLLTGGRDSVAVVDRFLRQVGSVRVPVLLALRGLLPADRMMVDSAARTPLTWLSTPTKIRRTAGLVGSLYDVVVTREFLEIRPDAPLDVARTVQSMYNLGRAGLTVLLSDSETDGAYALEAARESGGFVAVLEPELCPSPQAAAAALHSGANDLVLSYEEVVWLMIHAVPRRV
jgi:chemotaxis response regulator CheB